MKEESSKFWDLFVLTGHPVWYVMHKSKDNKNGWNQDQGTTHKSD